MTWNITLWGMRFVCPFMVVACAVVGYFAWRNGSPLTLAADAFLAGINVALTWFQWRVLQPRR